MKKYEWPTMILPDGDKRFRSLEINSKGELIYEQTDLGKTTARLAPNGGDSDYEYWIIIEPAQVEEVLIRLIKDRFKNQSAFKKWLERNEIGYNFLAY